MRDYKRIWRALCPVVFLSVCLTSCERIFPDTEKSNKDNDSPGTNFSFWVKANISDEAAVRYKIERIFVAGLDGGKIGSSLADGQGRFKITLPASYRETKQRFTVEFSRQSSFLDGIPAIANNPMAVSILKAFYYTTPESSRIKLPKQGAEITIPSQDKAGEIEIADMKMGYSEQSHEVLIKLPNIPPLYKIELNQEQVSKYTSQRYRAYFGFVDTPETELSSTDFKGGEPDPNSYAGFCSGDDWYLIINEKASFKAEEGTKVRLWIVFTHQSMSARLCYKDIELPEVYGNISVVADFAGLPVDDAAFTALLTNSYPDTFGNTPLAKDSYVQIKSISTSSWLCQGIFPDFGGEWHGGSYTIKNILFENGTKDNYYGLFGKMEGKAAAAGTNEQNTYAIVTDLILDVHGITLPASNLPKTFGGITGFAGSYTKISKVKVQDNSAPSAEKFSSVGNISGCPVGSLVGEKKSGGVEITIEDCSGPISLIGKI